MKIISVFLSLLFLSAAAIAEHPEEVAKLRAAYDQWWADCQPLLVNENAVGRAINPFQELYYKQFGGSPTPEALAKMDPNRKAGREATKSAKRKRNR